MVHSASKSTKRRSSQLQLPFTSLMGEYKVTKVDKRLTFETIMMTKLMEWGSPSKLGENGKYVRPQRMSQSDMAR